MKCNDHVSTRTPKEAPRGGAGIEILMIFFISFAWSEAPRGGAGIEISATISGGWSIVEAPRGGAGIEISRLWDLSP